MTTVNADVTEGFLFALDSQGRFQITKDRLNAQAKPLVTLTLTGVIKAEDLATDAVETAKIKDKAVTPAKINAVVAANVGAPILLDDNRVVTIIDWADGTLSLDAQPDVPRNITILLTDADNSVTGTMTVTGKDTEGASVVETMSPDGLGAGKALTGTKIFAQVDSVVITATAGATGGVDQVIVGVGNIIGLPTDIKATSAVNHVYLGGIRQTSPTVSIADQTSGVDASAGTYDGSKDLIIWYNLGG